jgi:four helix bundle protein
MGSRPRLRTSRCSSGRIVSLWLSTGAVSAFPRSSSGRWRIRSRRASKSICANLAEGFARQGLAPADFRRFVMMAMGSADEMRVWTRYCLDLGYVDEATWQSWRQEYHEIAKMLQGLLKSLGHRV